MDEFIKLVALFGFSPVNTLLLVLIWLTIRKKIKEHDLMYEWFIGKRAVDIEIERLRKLSLLGKETDL